MRPSYYSPAQAGELYLTRDTAVLQAVEEQRQTFEERPDAERTALFIIDPNIDFCLPGGGLYVPGAEQDTARLCEFIYDNLASIGRVYCTLDTHKAFQIFFPSFWQDRQGNYPAPHTVISAADIRTGRWMARSGDRDTAIAAAYAAALEKEEKYALIIWPFHTRKATVGQAVVPALAEAFLFYELMTGTEVIYKEKGSYTYTENYSVISPEVTAVPFADCQLDLGQGDEDLVTELLGYDRIYVAGQASSHCVKATMEDILRCIQARGLGPEAAAKFRILTDCMSPVIAPGIDFPALARQALEKCAAAGIQLVQSTDRLT